MPTQRPFLSNFLAAFRAHSQPLPKPAPSLSSSSSTTTPTAAAAATSSLWTSSAQPSKPHSATSTATPPTTSDPAIPTSPRPINPKATNHPRDPAPASSTPHQQPDRHLHASLSPPPLQHHVTPQTHLPTSSSASSGTTTSPGGTSPASHPPSYPTCQETSLSGSQRRAATTRRRGSDSSADSAGFRDVRGGGGKEAWLIGGRTREGEERCYRLGRVRRETSADRVSADRLSL